MHPKKWSTIISWPFSYLNMNSHPNTTSIEISATTTSFCLQKASVSAVPVPISAIQILSVK